LRNGNAVSDATELYVGPPLQEKLKTMSCTGCGALLAGNTAEYPETYVWEGRTFQFEKPTEYPPDETSIVREFPAIHDT
jgi:hypothetical protein